MRSFTLTSALLLLLTLAAYVECAFLDFKGESIADTTGYVFTMSKPFKLFGTEYTTSINHYMTRGTGRIMFGTEKDLTLFDPAKRRENHMLQPLEIVKMTNNPSLVAVTTLSTGTLNETYLTNISAIVRENFWGLGSFTATDGRVFTWEGQSSSEDTSKKNDFQAILVSDGSATFAIFNFNTVNYTVSTDSQQMLSGFSRAQSYETTSLPFSGAEATKLNQASGVSSGQIGRFVYRVDTWPPVRGGCLTEDPTSDDNRVLSTSVSVDSVLGGLTAVVAGRCHSGGSGQKGTCSVLFNNRVVATSPANGCDACGKAFLTCQVPASLREGRAQLSLSLTNTRASTAYTRDFLFVGPHKEIGNRIGLTNSEHWMTLEPQQLVVTFDARVLNGSSMTLKVFGYSEEGLTELESGDAKASLIKELYSRNLTSSNSGSLDLRNPAVKCTNDADCKKYHVGYLQISDDSQPPNIIRSDIVPLGWFVHESYKSAGQPEWFNSKCQAWAEANDEQTTKVKTQLKALTCPCTKQLALADTSRFLPVSYCPHLTGGCSSATPAQTCFVSMPATAADLQATPASLCCYDSEKNYLLHQELMDKGATTQQGSRTFRSHPDGSPSSTTLLAGQASFMSHWYWDTMKQLYCCRWSSSGYCPFYFMQARPTPSCSGFKLGRSSSSVGDPHLTSLNNQNFLFNGYGEFWLVRSTQVSVQGRFVTTESDKKFSLLTAIGVKVGDGAAFEVKLSSSGPTVQRRQSNQTTTVTLTNGESYREGGVTLRRVSDSQLIAVLTGDAGSVGVDIQTVNDLSFANLHVSVSDSLKGQTRGLLGRWTENAAEGFVNADGSGFVTYNSNMSVWNTQFCELHRVASEAESLFNYESAATRQVGYKEINVDKKDEYMKVALFDDSGLSHSNQAVCGDNADCLFDIRVTQNEELAKITKTKAELFATWRADNYTANFCDKPAIAGIEIDATDSLQEGSSLQLRCTSPLTTSTSGQSVACEKQDDGSFKWNPEPNVQCALPSGAAPQSANVGLIIGIVGGCLALLIIIVVVVFVVLRNRDDQPKQSGRKHPSQQQQQQQQPPRMNASDVVIDSDGRQMQEPQTQMESARDHRFSYQQSQQQPLGPDAVDYQEYSEPQKVSRSEVV